MQVDFICACKNTIATERTKRHHSKPFKCSRSLAKGVKWILVSANNRIFCVNQVWLRAVSSSSLIQKDHAAGSHGSYR